MENTGLKFERYQSLKKYLAPETDGIDLGTTYVFPKLDGTAAQVYRGENGLEFTSRNRVLTEEEDNADFYKLFKNDTRLIEFFEDHPDTRLYGEFLVKHTFKDYTDDAWGKFYIYDVVKEDRYTVYEDYANLLDEYGLDYIPVLAKVQNGEFETFLHLMNNHNTYLVKDGCGVGEGIVLKNYQYVNKFGNIVWAKMITNEFKNQHRKAMGPLEYNLEPIEFKIANKYVTDALVEKEFHKIILDQGEWSNKLMPRLLETVFYCLITEEFYTAIKKEKVRQVDIMKLQKHAYRRVKEVLLQMGDK